jgi:hypothetical protein
MKTKPFDCVEMKRRGAKQIREKLAGKTLDEQLAYWQTRTAELLARQEALRQGQSRVPGS